MPEWVVEFRRQYLVNRPITRYLNRRRLVTFRKHQRAVFVTFADGNVFKSERLQNEILQTGFFDTIHAYTAASLGPDFYETFSEHIKHPRGFGFWCWKPYVMLKELESLAEGDLLIYADAGCTVANDSRSVFEQLLLLLLNSDEKIMVAIDPQPRYRIIEWTKVDLLRHFHFSNGDQLLQAEQWPANRIAILRTQRNLQLVKDWCEIAKNMHLIDDTTSNVPEHHEFKEHRHDQAILSLLLFGRNILTGLETALYSTRLKH